MAMKKKLGIHIESERIHVIVRFGRNHRLNSRMYENLFDNGGFSSVFIFGIKTVWKKLRNLYSFAK